MDVTNAFPNADLNEDIYMTSAPGYSLQDNKVIKLNKALYGLKQSPNAWNNLINSFILSIGFVQSNDDCCIYMKSYSNSDMLYIGLYVDDIIICGNSIDSITKLKNIIANRYKCKDLGPIRKYLGMQVYRDRLNRTITLSMQSYIDDMLKQYCMTDCK